MYRNIGSSNREISPLYQSIRDTQTMNVPFGDPDDSLFEPTIAWMGWLIKVYQTKEE